MPSPILRKRNDQAGLQSFRSKRLLHLAVKLAFDYHLHETRAITLFRTALRLRSAGLLPIKHQDQSLRSPADRPGQFHVSGRIAQAAVCCGVGEKLVYRHGDRDARIGIEKEIRSAARNAIALGCEYSVQEHAQ